MTGAEVNIRNYWPEVGKLLPKAGTAEDNIFPTAGQLFPNQTEFGRRAFSSASPQNIEWYTPSYQVLTIIR